MNMNGIKEPHAHAAFSTTSDPPRSFSGLKLPFHGPNTPCCSHNPPSDKRDMPCGSHKADSRNLVVCIDGTSNQFGDKNTNVIELYNLILKEGHNQRTWYNSGIGTYVQPSPFSLDFYKQWLFHTIDLAIAWDFKKTVLGAYRWLSENYEPGDCIFLFGFSRGAYQVRVLSAMIEKVGLIYKGNEMQIPFAYEVYADPNSGDNNSNLTKVGQLSESTSKAARFKSAFSMKDVKVHFVGAWDTVSSIGVVRGTNMLPLTIDGMKHVCHFRHALALDERRVKFLPEYAYGGSSMPAYQDSDTPFNKAKDSARQTTSLPHTKEVWFAGTHSDIGGGNIQNAGMDRSRPPLRWMVFEAGAAGLRTAPFERELSANEQITVIESLNGFWPLLEILPIKRLSYTRKENGQTNTTRMPHRGSPRKIHPGQKIHSSLLRTHYMMSVSYIPKARPFQDDRSFWETLRNQGISGGANEWLELDLKEYIKNIVNQLITEGSDATLQSLHHTTISSDARQNLYDAVIEALTRRTLTPTVKQRLLRTTMDVLKRSCHGAPDFQLVTPAKIRPFLLDVSNVDAIDAQGTVQEFIALFTLPFWVFKIPDIWRVWSDGKHAASISRDRTVQIWDVETGKPVGAPLQGHTDRVWTLAFSSDGKHIVSGSDHGTVWIWDIETGQQVGNPLRGHTDRVQSVAFSPDGKHVVSGSNDCTVRIWDVETAKPVGNPLRGHTHSLQSVAFSSDGKHIVSGGSEDGTIWMWDVGTAKSVGAPLRAHTDCVRSVAFSPDAKRIVSGSDDGTIWIWDVETGNPVGKPLRGHTDWIRSVAFSSDGKHIVSGSDDRTVRIWDAETGNPIGEPLRGHRDWVESVAFLSYGKRIVSASHDNTVRIWDMDHPQYIRD